MKSLSLFALTLACGVSLLRANETLAVVPDSASALGMAGGRYANVGDPAAVRTNPANILTLDAPAFEVNVGAWYGDINFTTPTGQSEKMGAPWKYLGSAYYVEPIKPGETAWGLGISTPYGISSEWPQDGPLKYLIPYKSSLLTVDLTPAFAFKVGDLSVGIGMELMYSDLKLQQLFPWSLLVGHPVMDGNFVLDGDGFGVGGFLGLNWEPVKGQRFALVGRLPLSISYSGDFTANNLPGAAHAMGFTSTSSFDSSFRYPGSIAAGYGWDVTDRFTLGFDAMWAANSSQQQLPLLIGRDQALLGRQSVPFNWRNSWEGGFGAQYKINESWKLRAGYLYASASQPDETFNPAVASNERHMLTIGAGWSGKKDTVDIALSYLIYPDRTITDNVQPGFDGRYSIQWYVVSLSYTHKF